ncbi:MAG TPA: ethanolamine ammonia-lyase subunit EutC [Xanthobacteraceae bacterium]|jgi:ethanolamine ammonia-lyase small subunit|nr:ethanolamine ammonia-lyase subunit EutC [Xanthobacteraceae bacterium]
MAEPQPTTIAVAPQTPPSAADDGAWAGLRGLTAARIGLARSGASLATGPMLQLRLAHARARDAVHAPLDEERLRADLAAQGWPLLTISSAVRDRAQYLMRPDLGRRLAPDASAVLADQAGSGHDVALVITDGLSARAVERHGPPLLAALLPRLRADGWRVAPLTLARQGRVAIGDTVAQLLRACAVVVLIGERPGLSAPDSMGAYLTWQPGPHTTDANRNCISNIRPDGIDPADAASKVFRLLGAMRARELSGIGLKDEIERLLIGASKHVRG